MRALKKKTCITALGHSHSKCGAVGAVVGQTTVVHVELVVV